MEILLMDGTHTEGAQSGNLNERLEVSSGTIVAIDHYMPACPAFRKVLEQQGIEAAVKDFGGVTCALENGSYSVLRNPYEKQMVVCPLGSIDEGFRVEPQDYDLQGKLLVDTRCMLLLDAALLKDSELLSSFRALWIEGSEGQKKARDLIRSRGGAVRYGFSRGSDEIFVGRDPSGERIGMWTE